MIKSIFLSLALLLAPALALATPPTSSTTPNVLTTAPITVGHTIINDGGTSYVDGGAPGGTGDVNGPASSVINNFSTYSDITGKNIKDSGVAVGTSGATIPLLNGANTWSALQTFSTGILTATTNVTNTITFGASGVNGSIALTTGSVAIGNAAVAPNFEDVSIGTFAGTLQNSSAGENTCVGYNCLARNVSSGHLTGMGSGALWHELGGGSSAFGSVSQRDYVSSGNNTSIGSGTLLSGGGIFNLGAGINALNGNSSYIGVTGTCLASGTVALTFTGTYTGSPQTVTYTCVGTDTAATVVSGLITAINANTTLTADSPGAPGMVTVNDSANLTLIFAGTQTTGVAITTTSALTSAGSISLVVGGGATGNNNIAAGEQALYGHLMTTANEDIAIGQSSLLSVTTASQDIAIGELAGTLISTGSGSVLIGTNSGATNTTGGDLVGVGGNTLQHVASGNDYVGIGGNALSNYIGGGGNPNVAVGAFSFQGASGFNGFADVGLGAHSGTIVTTANNDTFIGDNTGKLVTTGNNDTLLGSGVGGTTLATGSGVLLIGTSNACDTPASNTNFYLALCAGGGPIISATGGNTPSTSVTTVAGLLTAANLGSGTATNYVCQTSAGALVIQATPCLATGGNGSGAEQTISFQPGLLTAVTNTKGVFGKFVKASTVDNLIASAINFTCVGNPTVTLYECGTDASCATSPTTIGTATVTAAGAAVTGTVSAPAITAGDFVAWAISAGTCTSLDISANAQVHAN